MAALKSTSHRLMTLVSSQNHWHRLNRFAL